MGASARASSFGQQYPGLYEQRQCGTRVLNRFKREAIDGNMEVPKCVLFDLYGRCSTPSQWQYVSDILGFCTSTRGRSRLKFGDGDEFQFHHRLCGVAKVALRPAPRYHALESIQIRFLVCDDYYQELKYEAASYGNKVSFPTDYDNRL